MASWLGRQWAARCMWAPMECQKMLMEAVPWTWTSPSSFAAMLPMTPNATLMAPLHTLVRSCPPMSPRCTHNLPTISSLAMLSVVVQVHEMASLTLCRASTFSPTTPPQHPLGAHTGLEQCCSKSSKLIAVASSLLQHLGLASSWKSCSSCIPLFAPSPPPHAFLQPCPDC